MINVDDLASLLEAFCPMFVLVDRAVLGAPLETM